MDVRVAESSIGNSYEAPRTVNVRAAIEGSIKKSWDPSHLKVPFRYLATQHKNIQKRKSEILPTVDSEEMKV